MSLFVEFLRFILCCCTEHFVDDHSTLYDTPLPNPPPCSSLGKAKVAVNSWNKPPYVQESFQRTNEISPNFSNSLPPSFSYSHPHSSSNLPSSSIFSSFPVNPPKSSSKPSASSLKGPPSPIGPSSSSPKSPPTFKPVKYPTTSHAINEEKKTSYVFRKATTSLFASTISNPPPSSSSSSPLPPNPPKSFSKPSASSQKGPPPAGPSSSAPTPSPTFKPVLYPTTSPGNEERKKSHYILEKSTSPIFAIPEYIRGQIEENTVPEILKQPLSPSTYKARFTALLYAEDFYLEVFITAQ